MLRLPSKLILARPLVAVAALGLVALAAVAAEVLLTLAGVALARRAEPRPYLLTHLLAGGSIGIGLLALELARHSLGLLPTAPPLDLSVRLARLGVVGLVLYGFYLEPRWIDTPELEIHLAVLPPGLNGLRIALISDLHVGPHFGPQDVERVVEMTNRLNPDVVALLGDYEARNPDGAAIVADGATRLVAPLGVYAVFGNHEYWVDPERVDRDLAAAGVQVLRNRGVPLQRDDGRLWLAGLEDIRRGQPDLPAALTGARPGEPVVLLVHNPMAVYSAERLGVPLVLAGHTHGGQIQLPLLGPLILPIPDRGLNAGLLRVGRSQMYVTRGVGLATPPVRLGSRPEITLLVLRSD